jgi:WD40 repeat protein
MKRTRATLVLTLALFSVLCAVARAAGNSDWKPKTQIKLPAKASSIAYSSDGSRIAVGHPDGRVSIWTVKSGELVRLLNAHSKEVNSVQFILQDSRLLTIGDDARARLWSTSDWNEAGTIEGVAFSGGVSPDSRWLAAQDPKQAIWIWDLSTLKQVKQLTPAGKGGTQNITFTADGKYIATAYNAPLLMNVDTKESLSFVSGGEKRTTIKLEPQQGNQVALSLGPLQDDDAMTRRVMPSRVGSLVALGRGWYGQTPFIDVWDMSVTKRLGRYKVKDAGSLTSFSFDNSLLAVEGEEKVTILKLPDGKQIGSIKGAGIMQFSPASIELAVTDGDKLTIFISNQ